MSERIKAKIRAKTSEEPEVNPLDDAWIALAAMRETMARQGDSIMEWGALTQKAASDAIRWQGRAEAAEAELARLREALEPFIALVERQDASDLAFLKKQGGDESDMSHYAPDDAKVHSSGEMHNALYLTKGDFRRLAKAALASPPRESVTVKPLEWRPHIRRAGWFVADVPPGQYFVWELAGFGYWSHGSTVGREVLGGLDAAKDAAQRDYETRIRSALSQPEAPASLAEGWVMVPQRASMAMLNAAIDTDSFKLGDISPLGFRCSPQSMFERAWCAMVAAAPKPGSAS